MSESLKLKIFEDAQKYISAVRPYLENREEENGLFLGNLGMHEANKSLVAHFMGEVQKNGKTAFAAFYREINLIISRGEKSAIPVVADKLRELNIDIPGVVGPSEESEAMALEWARVRGCSYYLSMDQLLYKLTKVDWPSGISGHMRSVSDHDSDLLLKWIQCFHKEALPNEPYTVEQARQNVEKRIPAGMTFIWEVDGKPVSMAALARPSANGITVNAVYTPDDQRKRGYATALVATISNEGLKRGKSFCTLYTDLMNPTSNSIYQKIGYRVVCGSRNYRFR
jgi:uncharacterized protein